MIDYKYIMPIIEALIFASDEPLSTNRILKVLEDLKANDVQKAIDELNSEYENSGRSFRVRKIGGGYQFIVKPEFSKYIKNMYKGRTRHRLSNAALEVLTIIAFKQPIGRPEVDLIRGVNSDGVVRNLLERNLISISGRAETAGRALLYGTTPEFLVYFGLNEISDLPKPREMEELLGSAQEELRFASEEDTSQIIDELAELEEDENSDDQVE